MALRAERVLEYGKRGKRREVAYGRGNRSRHWAFQRELPPVGEPPAITARPVVQREAREAGPFTIQGQSASDLEWRVYKALKRLRWRESDIDFQTNILGGRYPGGQVLDFVLYGRGAIYVIPVNGDYWHRFGPQGVQTRFNEARVKEVMPNAIIIPLWTGDLLTDESAYSVVSRLIGRGG